MSAMADAFCMAQSFVMDGAPSFTTQSLPLVVGVWDNAACDGQWDVLPLPVHPPQHLVF